MAALRIRPEAPGDTAHLQALTTTAFEPMSFSDGTEADALDRLRSDGDLLLSLVAEIDSRIVGHVAFSPLQISDGSERWVGLGPISVEPSRQRQGIGRTLIAEGMDHMRSIGMNGVALIGNPAVYQSSGFISDGRLTYRDVPVQYVQYHLISGPTPLGEVTFSKGLE